MKDNSTPEGTNIKRRALGIAGAIAPILLAIACIFCPTPFSLHFQQIGLILVRIALALACLNFWLSFVRPLLLRLLRVQRPKHVSGFPLIGTVLQIIGVIFGFGNVQVGVTGLLAAIMDTGGQPWFVIFTWKDKSLWDR